MTLLVLVTMVFVAALGTVIVVCRDPARQAVTLSAFGLSLSLAFVVVGAPDVALSQLTVGAVVVPLMVLFTHRKLSRRGDE